jgi:hypothetical protein
MENTIMVVLFGIIVLIIFVMLLFWQEVVVVRDRKGVMLSVTVFAPGDISPRRLSKVRDAMRADIGQYLDEVFVGEGRYLIDPTILSGELTELMIIAERIVTHKERKKPYTPKVVIHIIFNA